MGASRDMIDIGIDIHSSPAAEQVVDRINAKLRAFRAEAAKPLEMVGEVNALSGAFIQLSRQIDLTDTKAVAAFRREGDALSVYLAKLGATDAELNRIAKTITQVEVASGRARVIAPDVSQVIGMHGVPVAVQNIDRLGGKLRTAANAASLLSANVAMGTGSIQGMAVAAGSLAQGIAAFATGGLGIWVAAIGAAVTAIVTITGAIKGWRDEHRKLNEERAKSRLDEFVKQTEEVAEIERKATAEALRLAIERTQGEVAARRAAIEEEFQEERRRILANTEAVEEDRAKATAAARRRRNEQLAALDRELADRQKQSQTKLVDEEVALIRKATLDAATIRKRDADDVFRAEHARLEKEFRERRINQDQFDIEIVAAARIRALKVQAIEREQAETLKQIVAETEGAILELTGRSSEARRQQIIREFDERIKKAREAKATEAQLGEIGRERTLRLGALDFEDLEKTGTRALSQLDLKLKETATLAEAGALSEGEARARVLQAYRETGAELSKIIPKLEAMARAASDQGALDAVATLKQRLLEIEVEAHRVVDRFAELKDALREGATGALTGLFRDSVQLIGQSTPQVDALRAQLQGAQQELQTLLAGPPSAQAGERIDQLRNEIARLRVELDNSRQAVHGWADAFVNALNTVVQALEEVLAKMAATAIIAKATSLFSSTPSTAAINQAVQFLTIGRASGGLVHGPGTETSDSVLARLSRGEYVIRAERVRQFGVEFFEWLNGAALPRLRPRFAFADGGFVQPAQAVAPMGSFAGGSSAIEDRIRLEIAHNPDAIVRILDSPAGHRLVLNVLQQNQRAARAALGNGGGF